MANVADVGIHALNLYIPLDYVSQADIERNTNTPQGKITKGLMQDKMAVLHPQEDSVSLTLSAVHGLLDSFSVDPKQVSHLQVGTESLVDKSKSIKSFLMPLFPENPNIPGVDSINACYGGTAALFNAINYIYSPFYKPGSYAMVVAVDNAVYAPGPARPTGGTGAIAMLIGPNAPLVLEKPMGHFFEHVYDFYKPDPNSEYPTVDGPVSNECYLRSLRNCWEDYSRNGGVGLDEMHRMIFHAPYGKLVQKSYKALSDIEGKQETSEDAWKQGYETKVKETLKVSNQVGNMYTGSVYGSLCCVADSVKEGERIGVFSYGSGSAATMFSFRKSFNPSANIVQNGLNLLENRNQLPFDDFTERLRSREENYSTGFGKERSFQEVPEGLMRPGGYYLTKIDNLGRRQYNRMKVAGLDAKTVSSGMKVLKKAFR